MVIPLVFVAMLVLVPTARAYSVLSHEAIIDAVWDDSIKPILLKRFPNATEDDLRKAHALAYGGAIIQDLGYYPFGNKLFSDLTHYVRSGDFIVNMISSATDLNEYAFALGSLAHYAADTTGHAVGVNRAVAMMYPKLRRKFGDVVTYADNRVAHMKAEFSFDVVQVANGQYAPAAYQHFIGFDVSKAVLERAFAKTYALKLEDVMLSVDLALGSYRYAVGTLIPDMTRVAWAIKGRELTAATPGLTRDRFVYNMSRASFEKEWGRHYKRPGIVARILGFIIRILPKAGPLRAFAFRTPTAEAERAFMQGFNQTLAEYRSLLAQVLRGESVVLPNRNFDTGRVVARGEYGLADKAYSELIEKLSRSDFSGADADLRRELLAFYAGSGMSKRKVAEAIQKLKSFEK